MWIEYRFGNAVGHEQHRVAGFHPDPLQLHVHLVAGQRIQGAERLIHQQQLRVVDQGAADRGALSHPAGQLARIALGKFRQAAQGQQLAYLALICRHGLAGEFDRQQDIAPDVAPFQQRIALEHHAHALRRPVHRHACHLQLAAGEGLQARHAAQKRTLAAPARPQDADEAALRHVDRHRGQRLHAGRPRVAFTHVPRRHRPRRHGCTRLS
ncbi:hypothetical protein G6F22_017103 [Rhizopus arrhizus]|nr:hypothetical protein G6F22_017103 [Rhizopus arrhizus]